MRASRAPIAMLLFFCVSCDPGETTTVYDTGVFFDLDQVVVDDGSSDDSAMPFDDDLVEPSDEDALFGDDPGISDIDMVAPVCPDDMAEVGNICVDRYEASRGNAKVDNAGDDETVARSVAGVLPWMVNPMTADALNKFKAACAAAGKHLCSVGEWMAACEGPEKRVYHFGGTFDREICNCVDTFCDDFCAEHNIAVCNTEANCGYDYESFHVMPTGSFPDCTAGDGLFDVNGNVWEIVDNGSGGFLIKGGAFNCAGAADRLKCSFSAGWTELFAGFRCCKDR